VARFDRRWTVWPLKAPCKAIPDETLNSTVTASVVNMTAVEGANASARDLNSVAVSAEQTTARIREISRLVGHGPDRDSTLF
jgi:hypothetical protein